MDRRGERPARAGETHPLERVPQERESRPEAVVRLVDRGVAGGIRAFGAHRCSRQHLAILRVGDQSVGVGSSRHHEGVAVDGQVDVGAQRGVRPGHREGGAGRGDGVRESFGRSGRETGEQIRRDDGVHAATLVPGADSAIADHRSRGSMTGIEASRRRVYATCGSRSTFSVGPSSTT